MFRATIDEISGGIVLFVSLCTPLFQTLMQHQTLRLHSQEPVATLLPFIAELRLDLKDRSISRRTSNRRVLQRYQTRTFPDGGPFSSLLSRG
ncbi:hypothetical protein HN51_068851 [Arachis hypogaea]